MASAFHLDEPNGMVIVPLTEIGEVTSRLLGLNAPDRLLERRALQIADRYPVAAAQTRLFPPPKTP